MNWYCWFSKLSRPPWQSISARLHFYQLANNGVRISSLTRQARNSSPAWQPDRSLVGVLLNLSVRAAPLSTQSDISAAATAPGALRHWGWSRYPMDFLAAFAAAIYCRRLPQ